MRATVDRLKDPLNNMLSLCEVFQIAEGEGRRINVQVHPAQKGGGYSASVNSMVGMGHNPEHALFAAAQHFFKVPETERIASCRYDYRTEPTAGEVARQMIDYFSG